jgi:hypothetical protein
MPYDITGKIASKISALADTTLKEISGEHAASLDEYIKYMKKDPIARSCCELKALRAAITVGDYEHQDKQVQFFIREMFANISGSLSKVIAQLASAMPLGFSAAEIEFGLRNRKMVVKSLDVLDQRHITFKGSNGQIRYLMYRDNQKKPIPYWKVIHVVNGFSTDFDDPFGNPEMQSALAFIKAKNAFLSNMVIAGKNLATGILVGKVTDTTVNLYDRNGRPIKSLPASEALARQFEGLESNSWMVTDSNNDIFSVQVGDGSQFWASSLNQFDLYIKRSFTVPDLVFNEGSSSLTKPASLAGKHVSLMDSTIQAIVEQIRDELIEKAVKPVIQANWGRKISTYGTFDVSAEVDEASEQMNTQMLINALSMGIIDGQTDMDAVNKLRDRLDLPHMDMTTKKKQMLQQMELQSISAGAPQPGAEVPPPPEEEMSGQYP